MCIIEKPEVTNTNRSTTATQVRKTGFDAVHEKLPTEVGNCSNMSKGKFLTVIEKKFFFILWVLYCCVDNTHTRNQTKLKHTS